MKKNLLTLILCSFAFGLGLSINNVVMGDNLAGKKVGYVDVPKLLASSKTLKAAETTRNNQTKDMLKWYESIGMEINKQQTAQEKQAMIKKYEPQLAQKKKTIKDNFAKKVDEVDKQLDSVIAQKSKELGYDLVLRKDSVLYGGEDITTQIVPLVK